MLKYKDFLIELLPLVNLILYYDRDVNDVNGGGAGNDDKDDYDLTIKFIQKILYQTGN